MFIDGNHENFDLLNALPVEVWNGGKVHRVSDSIIHLMRGQVSLLDGQTFLTMGGGNLIDKQFRLPERSWWSQEMPSETEYDKALANLVKHQYKVDYIITHAAPESLMCLFHPQHADELELNLFLQGIMEKAKYRHWYFAHLHEDRLFSFTHGNKTLKSTLTQSAKSAQKVKSSFLSAQYARPAAHRGKNRATMAVAHSIAIAIFFVLKGVEFKDLGADYYTQFNREKKINSHTRQLSKLGVTVPDYVLRSAAE